MPSTGIESPTSSNDVERKRKMPSAPMPARKRRHIIPVDDDEDDGHADGHGDDGEYGPEVQAPVIEQATATSLTPKADEEPVTDPVHGVLTAVFKDVRELVTCKVCVRLLYEPYTLSCGHTYCYSCLSSWFGSKKDTCPDCRAIITERPAPAYLVRELVHKLILKDEFLLDDDSMAQHMIWQREEADLVEKDRLNTDTRTGGLFGGIFRQKSRASRHGPIVDIDDHVLRCPHCNWELEDGICDRCGPIDDDEDLPSEDDSFGDAEREEIISLDHEGDSLTSNSESDEDGSRNIFHRHGPVRHRPASQTPFAHWRLQRGLLDENARNLGRRLAERYGIRYESQSEDNSDLDLADEQDDGSDLDDFIVPNDEEEEQDDEDEDEDDAHSQDEVFDEDESGVQVEGVDDEDSDEGSNSIDGAIQRNAMRAAFSSGFSPLADVSDSDEEDSNRPIDYEGSSSPEGIGPNMSDVADSRGTSMSDATVRPLQSTGDWSSMGNRNGSSARFRRRLVASSDEESEDENDDDEDIESEDEVVNRRQRRRIANSSGLLA